MDLNKKHLNRLRMRRCFDVARLGVGQVKTNPMVGAIVVKNKKIVSEGYHQSFGGPHAEVNAIVPLKENELSNSSIYVSLEPCAHYGKTPPCADLVRDSGVSKCFISNIDPNPLVSGKGINRLRSGGVEVIGDIEPLLGQKLLRPFLARQKHNRPYIILKWAQSRDGFLGQINHRTKISALISDRLVHKWRAESDCIMVGSQTVIIDSPHLSNRYYFGSNPVRVILDRRARIAPSARIWTDQIKTLYFSNNQRHFSNPMIESVTIHKGEEDPLIQVFSYLHRAEYGSVLVEGGPTLLKACFNLGLWDEARIIESPICLKHGIPAPLPMGDRTHYQQLGQDEISFYDRT